MLRPAGRLMGEATIQHKMKMKKNKDTQQAPMPELSAESAKAIDAIKAHIDALPPEKKPKVCISSITYNHGKFIRQTLESFVMQQTTFPFVAIVHDDASTDDTADIIREYAERYPDIIFPIIETENQYRKPGGPLTLIMHRAAEATGAPYIAKCEGDDYWTDPLKLQKQADFLDTHPEYVMCTHNYSTLNQGSGKIEAGQTIKSESYDLSTYIIREKWFYQVLSFMYRFKSLDFDNYMRYPDRRDTTFTYLLLKNGNGYYMDDDMGVYRIHSNGVWSGVSSVSTKYLAEFRCRHGIYLVDKNNDSSRMLLWPLYVYGRKIALTNIKVLSCIIASYTRHFGIQRAIKLLIKRFVLNRKGPEEFKKASY